MFTIVEEGKPPRVVDLQPGEEIHLKPGETLYFSDDAGHKGKIFNSGTSDAIISRGSGGDVPLDPLPFGPQGDRPDPVDEFHPSFNNWDASGLDVAGFSDRGATHFNGLGVTELNHGIAHSPGMLGLDVSSSHVVGDAIDLSLPNLEASLSSQSPFDIVWA